MTSTFKLVSTLVMASAVVLTGCNKKQADATPDAVVAPAPAAAETAAAAPAPAANPAATPAPVAAPGASFDINSVPMSTATLPPFPYLDWPAKLEEGQRNEEEQEFDGVSVIAGTDVRPVEGRVSRRYYSLSNAKLSKLAAERNYEAALKAMGAVQVNQIQMDDPKLLEAHPALREVSGLRKTFKVLDRGDYKSYLIRTPKGSIWIAVAIDDYNATVVAVEEKAMEQSIKPLSAAQMQSELAARGHVALYMNFDTDKAIILDKDQGIIDEVSRMMASDSSLRLKVEGHTDSSGDAKRNERLSAERAGAVVASLVDKGVDKMRLAALGMGGSKPVADNGTEEGRAKNRRVELVRQG
ncbi:OmpA family protein [Massilia sp. PAMC28688]|uniref:OmpA family protein n=1 Tax=Massilia sp. PAMC28688 TaxID=2861283 RepID=UPI001C636900|nr:OmpA family protein [Massilia sp. PAMC28688]QYF94358.1 OmpA family protein [Massilia sp. PAMC28688]